MNVWISANRDLQWFQSSSFTDETSFLLFSQKWFWACFFTLALSLTLSIDAVFLP